MRHRRSRIRTLFYQKGVTVMRFFYKLFLDVFADILLNLPCNYCKVIGYVLIHINGNNRLELTYAAVADAIGCSSDTVGTIIRQLLQNNFIKRIPRTNTYMVNPEVIMKGREGRFKTLKERYDAI